MTATAHDAIRVRVEWTGTLGVRSCVITRRSLKGLLSLLREDWRVAGGEEASR